MSQKISKLSTLSQFSLKKTVKSVRYVIKCRLSDLSLKKISKIVQFVS